ncbi:MAG: N-acetylornithine carbamoyltransferase [Cytophagaceae bacterium]|nr:N-acetylornithine carbamoyltransferase [Cytophagaceae bacterium]
MRHFTSVKDVDNLDQMVTLALELKKDPLKYKELGRNKTLGLIFFNPSLRTRLSTQKAAHNLTLRVMDMNVGQDSWSLEFRDNIVMDANTTEHIKEAAAVMGQYCDIIGIRAFPSLNDKESDYKEEIIQKFIKYSGVPLISLESATLHPLQSFADLVTIEELKKKERPKVVLTWAAHPKALPQAVPNSFAEWMNKANVDFVITHPEGYELDEKFTEGAKITYDQNEALRGADFVYAKNWSSYEYYGNILSKDKSWTVSKEKMALTNNGKFMHCLPVRRNVEVTDDVLDSDTSVVIHQAGNRVWSAQAVMKKILDDNF